MIKPPILLTNRLQLSIPTKDDIEELVVLLNESEDFSKNTLNMPYPYQKEHGEFWIHLAESGLQNDNAVILAIRDRNTLAIMGGIGLYMTPLHHKSEVGYWIGKPYWNQGFVTEALASVIQYGFKELNLHKIYATHFSYNPTSGRVMEKCGMIKEAILRDEYFKNGEYLDVNLFSILRPF